MLISSKGRYALRVMTVLAEHGHDDYIPLSEIAREQEISEKYLEGIIGMLSKGGLLDGMRGKGGGYRLNRKPEEYSVGEVLRAVEGSLAPVSCMSDRNESCKRSSECRNFPVWQKLDRLISDYLDSVTLADLAAPRDGE